MAVAQALIALVVVFSTSYPDVGWFLAAESDLDIALRIATAHPIASISSQE